MMQFKIPKLYSSLSRIIKPRRWAGHVVRLREKRNANRILWKSQKERDHQEDQDVREWAILKQRDRMGWYGLDGSG
jgi:hypothetical protein